MYHEQGKKQTEIAKALRISQARVSRLLQRATDLGIVRTVVTVPGGLYPDLEQQLEERFGIEEAIVCEVDQSEANLLSSLGSATARHLETTIQAHDRIGISSWSETLLAAVRSLRPSATLRAESVIQLVGGQGNPSAQMSSNIMLRGLSDMLRARPQPLLAPAVMGSAAARSGLISDTSLAPMINSWREITVALVGIGALEQSPLLASSGNTQDEADRAELASIGAAGDVCLRYFDSRGRHLNSRFDSRVVAIDAETFRSIPRRIGVAGGTRKIDAVLGSLRGKWITTLITDHQLATSLLEHQQ